MSLQVVQAPTPPPLPTVPPWESLPPQVVVLVLLALIAGTTIVLWPLVRAIARRIEGRGGKETAHLQDEIDQLRERVAELEATQTSMAELEERLDFAERLLTRSRESAGLPPGQPLQ